VIQEDLTRIAEIGKWLSTLHDRLPLDALRAEYAKQIVGLNILGKPTTNVRELTFSTYGAGETDLSEVMQKLNIKRA
jgi:hypothetical protein